MEMFGKNVSLRDLRICRTIFFLCFCGRQEGLILHGSNVTASWFPHQMARQNHPYEFLWIAFSGDVEEFGVPPTKQLQLFLGGESKEEHAVCQPCNLQENEVNHILVEANSSIASHQGHVYCLWMPYFWTFSALSQFLSILSSLYFFWPTISTIFAQFGAFHGHPKQFFTQ